MIGAIFFAGKPQPSLAQNAPFKSYQLRVFCDNPKAATVTFWHDVPEVSMGVKLLCAGKCKGKTVPLAAALAGLPTAVSVALRASVEKHEEDAAAGNGRSVKGCLLDGEQKPPGCMTRDDERTGDVPWFDPSARGCNDLHDTQLTTTFSRGTCTYTLRACGTVILKDTVSAPNAANCTREYRAESYGGTAPLPQKVCCDIWREAARTGSGCNPEVDADCDGELNEKTQVLRLQDPYYAPSPGETDKNFNRADFDPLPPGLNWDGVMPNEPCKGCKWMATSAKLTCSPDKYKNMPESRKRDHEYKVTWKCPTSGILRVVTKRVAARLPCTPPSGQRSA